LWLEDDGWNGDCEELSLVVRGSSFEDAKTKMEAALQAHIESVLRKHNCCGPAPRACKPDVGSWSRLRIGFVPNDNSGLTAGWGRRRPSKLDPVLMEHSDVYDAWNAVSRKP
jgi:predicted RNase H-like HicB family nuclease